MSRASTWARLLAWWNDRHETYQSNLEYVCLLAACSELRLEPAMRQRRPLKITSRTSSVTNGFVQAILPQTVICDAQYDEARIRAHRLFGEGNCAYCGNSATDWDHLNPLVRNKRPTGHGFSASNLVPACGPCNQSKSGQAWEAWMKGKAKNSPSSRGVRDVEDRVEKLRLIDSEAQLHKIEIERLVSSDLLQDYWSKLEDIQKRMHSAQLLADQIREHIESEMMQAAAE